MRFRKYEESLRNKNLEGKPPPESTRIRCSGITCYVGDNYVGEGGLSNGDIQHSF